MACKRRRMSAEPALNANRPSPLPAIVLLLMAGVLTGAQLAKVAPLIPWYQAEHGMSLVATGWLAAILGLFIAVAALPAGVFIERFGMARALGWGAACIVAGGSWLVFATGPLAIFAARTIEAVGYLSLCIVLPAILSAISPPRWKGPVLAIWSGFVPLGFATSDFMAAAIIPGFDVPGYLAAIVFVFALVAGAAMFSLRGLGMERSSAASASISATLTLPIILVTIGFGIFVVLSLSMLTFLPAFVAQDRSRYLVSAGFVALTVPVGNVLAGVLVRGRGATYMAWLALAGFVVSALVAVPAFASGHAPLATAAAILLAISGAVVASAQFASIAYITPRAGSVPVAIGLVCQAGGIGTVIGPPLAAAVIERFGWPGLGLFLTLCSLAGIAAMIVLARQKIPSGFNAEARRPGP